MRTLIYVSILCFGFVIYFSSCNSKQPSLDNYFKNLNQELEQEILIEFKNSNEDSLNNFSSRLKDTFINLLHKEEDLNDFLESKGVKRDVDKFFIVIKSFHRKLNNKEIRLEDLIKEIQDYLFDTSVYYNDIKACKDERQKRASYNYDKWTNGDTLSISLPVKSMDGITNAYYYGCSSLNNNSSNHLSLKGILVKKDTIKYIYDDRIELSFKLNIIEHENPNTLILLKKLNVGDYWDLNLNSYGKIIE